MPASVTQLKVGDESFLVTSIIDRCPKVMMLRELVKNALEAAERAEAGDRRVEIAALTIEGVRKLAIWNTGPGMNADELYRMCDIASSIRKQQSLDQNFGMGAKVATLPSNRHGIRYRSCAGGVVHEVVLGQRGGIYGRIRRPSPITGQLVDVMEVTAAAQQEGRSIAHDWTEVVLLGSHPGQDTVADPFDGAPRMPVHWIAEDLYYKFFRASPSVELYLLPGVQDQPAPRRFASLSERAHTDYARYEAVNAADGITIHYFYDAASATDPACTSASIGAMAPCEGASGVIFKDEIYMPVRGWRWLQGAPIFGIPFGAANISAFIELPASYAVLPDGYRQFLRYKSGTQAHVEAAHFASLVRDHRPEWLIEIIGQLSPDSRHVDRVRNELDTLLRELRVPRKFWFKRTPAASDGPSAVQPPDQPIAAPAQEAADTPKPPSPQKPPEPAKAEGNGEVEPIEDAANDQIEPAPQIMALRNPSDIKSRGMEGRAGRYYPETHQLFINCLYPVISKMTGLLEREFASADDQETVRRTALQAAEQSMTLRIGRMLVFALAKRDSGWQEAEMGYAMSPASLSIAAEDFSASLPNARQSMRAALGAAAED